MAATSSSTRDFAKTGQVACGPRRTSGRMTGLRVRRASQRGPSPRSNCSSSILAETLSLAHTMVSGARPANTEIAAPETGNASRNPAHNVASSPSAIASEPSPTPENRPSCSEEAVGSRRVRLEPLNHPVENPGHGSRLLALVGVPSTAMEPSDCFVSVYARPHLSPIAAQFPISPVLPRGLGASRIPTVEPNIRLKWECCPGPR